MKGKEKKKEKKGHIGAKVKSDYQNEKSVSQEIVINSKPKK